jgi:hypothetical protein
MSPREKALESELRMLQNQMAGVAAENAALRENGYRLQNELKELKAEAAAVQTVDPRSLAFFIGLPVSGSQILADIVNSCESAMILSQFDYHLLRVDKKYGSREGEDIYERFNRIRSESLSLPLKGARLSTDEFDYSVHVDELWSKLLQTYKLVGDVIASPFGRDAWEVSELNLVEELLEKHDGAALFFNVRRPDDVLRVYGDPPSEERALTWVVNAALSLAIVLRGYATYPRARLVFYEDLGAPVVHEVDEALGIRCHYDANALTPARTLASSVRGASLPGMDVLMEAYRDAYELLQVDRGILKSLRTTAVVRGLDGIVKRLEQFGRENLDDPEKRYARLAQEPAGTPA